MVAQLCARPSWTCSSFLHRHHWCGCLNRGANRNNIAGRPTIRHERISHYYGAAERPLQSPTERMMMLKIFVKQPMIDCTEQLNAKTPLHEAPHFVKRTQQHENSKTLFRKTIFTLFLFRIFCNFRGFGVFLFVYRVSSLRLGRISNFSFRFLRFSLVRRLFSF